MHKKTKKNNHLITFIPQRTKESFFHEMKKKLVTQWLNDLVLSLLCLGCRCGTGLNFGHGRLHDLFAAKKKKLKSKENRK